MTEYVIRTDVDENKFRGGFEPLAKRYEEANMQGASERGSEAYNKYVELLSERRCRRSAPQ